MSGVALAELLAVAVLAAAAWLAKKYRVRISPKVSVIGLIVTIFATCFIGVVVQSRPEQIPFPAYAAIYVGGVGLSLVFTVLIFAARWQRREEGKRERGTNVLVRGAPASRRRSG